MAQQSLRTVALRIYEQVNLALWAALVALVIFCAVVIVPQMPRTRADGQVARAAAREHEDAFYCKHWGLSDGTPTYAKCMTDLITFRRSIEQQRDDESLP